MIRYTDIDVNKYTAMEKLKQIYDGFVSVSFRAFL